MRYTEFMKKQTNKAVVFVKTYYLDIAFQIAVFIILQRLLEECRLAVGWGRADTLCETDYTLITGILIISVVLNTALRKYLKNKKSN